MRDGYGVSLRDEGSRSVSGVTSTLKAACPRCGGALTRNVGAEFGLSVNEFFGRGDDIAMQRYHCATCGTESTAERVYRGGRMRVASR